MNIRRAQEKDMERINDLLVQVCMVHHKGRPDLFQGNHNRKYTDGQLKEIIHDEERPILWLRTRRTMYWVMHSVFSGSICRIIS